MVLSTWYSSCPLGFEGMSPSIRTAVTNLVMNRCMAQAPGEQGQEFASAATRQSIRSMRSSSITTMTPASLIYAAKERNVSVPRLWGDAWDSVARFRDRRLPALELTPRRSAPKGGALARRDEKLPLAAAPVGAAGTAVPRSKLSRC